MRSSLILYTLLVCTPFAFADVSVESRIQALGDWLDSQIVSPNSLSAALLKIKLSPQSYVIRIQEITGAYPLGEIQRFDYNQSTGWLEIDFSYRGGTTVRLKQDLPTSFLMRGAYKIDIPVIGTSEVRVWTTFSQDGSARGHWSNMGFSGSFDILKIR